MTYDDEEPLPKDQSRQMTDPVAIKEFCLAGDARITLVSKNSGTRFSFRVSECENKRGLFFVSVLVGSDNESSYKYLGTIRDQIYAHGTKSKISGGAPSAMGFEFFWRLVLAIKMHPNLEVWHEGKCGRCGRTLTVPESIERGIGPECAGKMGASVVPFAQKKNRRAVA